MIWILVIRHSKMIRVGNHSETRKGQEINIFLKITRALTAIILANTGQY